MREVNKIGVFGHYGNKNLGDEAIILAVIQNIRQRLPEAVIQCFSINPQDTASRYGVEAYPIRKTSSAANASPAPDSNNSSELANQNSAANQQDAVSSLKKIVKQNAFLTSLAKAVQRLIYLVREAAAEISFVHDSYKRLKDIDILLISGSNQFLDNFGGPWGFPFTLLKWSLIAKTAGTKVCYVSVGAGPISEKLSKTYIRWALKFADYVSLRDLSSQKMINELGYRGLSRVYPDLAHSLNIAHISPAPLPFDPSDRKMPVVGINPMPLYDPRYWCEKDDSKYTLYLGKMVDFTARLLDNGYPFFFFATMEKDNNVVVDILRELEIRRNVKMSFDDYALTSETVDGLMANIAAADLTVATRFHGTVLSLLSEKPMLGICYYRKAKELLFEMGQGDYAVDLDSFTVDDLWGRLESLVKNMDQEKKKITDKNSEYAKLLANQFDELLADTIP